MRDLLVHLHPTTWPQISAAVFGVGFLLLTVWVFLPSRKKTYEQMSAIPFDLE